MATKKGQSNTTVEIRPKLLMETIKELYKVKRTTCIEGPPGGGKTSLVQEAAKQLGVEYIEVHMPTMLVEDFGVPYPDGDKLSYKLPHWWPSDPSSEGILCFDDRNQASADLQKVLANICQARNLHGHKLPDGWMVVSTGNRQSDRAGANRVLSHLRNRETVYQMATNLDDWTTWALAEGVKPELVAFLRFAPHLLHDFDPNREANATPRSWVEGVSAVIGVVPEAAEFPSFCGAVGDGPASEFSAFLKIYRDLPSPDAVLLDPENYPIDKFLNKPDVCYALSAALANKANDKNFKAVLKFINRLPGEFGVLCAKLATSRDKKLQHSAAFTQWAVENQDVLF